MRPAEQLHAGELTIRRYRVDDAPALHEAVTASVDHLRPWMPWAADEPLTLAERRVLIEHTFDAGWEQGRDFIYGMFVDGTLVGGCGLHHRSAPDGLEIGYWVRAGWTGRGLATAAAGALCTAAFGLPHVTHVEIRHDKANVASSRVPAKLGFTLVGEHEDGVSAPAEIGICRVWRLARPLV